MKFSWLIRFICFYFLSVLLMALERPLFMLFNSAIYSFASFSDVIDVIYHGLPLDFAMAGYLSVLPGLVGIAAPWISRRLSSVLLSVWCAVTAFIIVLSFATDTVIYPYWVSKLDITPLYYFISSPSAALSEIELWKVIALILIIILASVLIFFLYRRLVVRPSFDSSDVNPGPKARIASSVIMLLATAILFIPIRGGFTVSTNNLSRAYYCNNLSLNHAAVNPLFSFFYSASHQSNFASLYRFMPEAEAEAIVASMTAKPSPLPADSLLSCPRPDVYLILMESFSSYLLPSQGGEPVALGVDSLASEGLLFSNIYGSSFRTDRGIPAVLSAYPGVPTTSIMRYTEKTDRLPSIPRSLKDTGWTTASYQGDDGRFSNRQAYILGSNIDRVVDMRDFPDSVPKGKWGVADHHLFDYLKRELAAPYDSSSPRFAIIQTSSSHEPFEVPRPLPAGVDKRVNAFQYADSAITSFVRFLQADSARWASSLVILVPDHQGAYPDVPPDDFSTRHHIPLIFTGGALRPRGVVPVLGSQTDIAATLLSMLDIPSAEFTFSRPLLSPDSLPRYAFFSRPSQAGIVTPEGMVVINCDADRLEMSSPGAPVDSLTLLTKAYLQSLYSDLDRR